MGEEMSIDKKDPVREGSEESMGSTPEAEAGALTQDNAAVQKRKGGRKPIYATSEERKQRNRQAQAAFRERRTEYIKQLEETIRVHETNLHNLQTAHRSAADECLMLRYKNSLLERILLEKGIDVQAELRAKTGSPHLGPTHMAPNMAQPPTVQRAIMNRHHQARRSHSSIPLKMEPIINPPHASAQSNPSPQSRPTPSSHASSPNSHSPGFNGTAVMTPPASDPALQQRSQQPIKQPLSHGHQNGPAGLGAPLAPAMKGPGNGASRTMRPGQTPYYASAPFQTHIEQLDQEYDAPNEMVDDRDRRQSSGPSAYAQQQQQQQSPQYQQSQHSPREQQQQPSRPQSQSQSQSQPQSQQQHGSQVHPPNGQQQLPPPNASAQQPGQPGQTGDNGPGFPSMTQLLDPYDPMLDMDPFGLSASMHFPTQFSFDTSSMR